MAEKNAEIPTDRCGFVLQPDEIMLSMPDLEWVTDTNPSCCWRSVWEAHDETDRCIWHADADEKPLAELIAARRNAPERLDGAILRHLDVEEDELSFSDCQLCGAKLDHSTLQNIDFTDADLRYSNFTGADLSLANFTDADLRWAELPNADLQGAKLPDADALGANFHHANLQEAVLMRTDCRRARLTSAFLYETVFSDTRINSITVFFDPETTLDNSTTSHTRCIYEERHLTKNDFSDDLSPINSLPIDVQPLEAARWVYRRLEALHKENALSEESRQFHISKEEAERALYWNRGEYGPWAVKTLMWYLTRHGESVKRVLIWWGIVIFAAGALFPFVGGVTDADGTEYTITSLRELGTIAGWQDILMNIYFSITTFSTIMDGGLAPAGNGTRAVVAVESITGALLVALLVFVLGRRTAR